MPRPPLILVTGPPGAGKSGLAPRLAAVLKLPLLAKDAVKETLMDALDVSTRADSERLGGAAIEILRALAAAQIEAGMGAVVEAAFHRPTAASDLGPLADSARTCIVHCSASDATLLRRYQQRAGSRHPGHFDRDRSHLLASRLRDHTYDPPDLGVPLLRVDTEDGLKPEFDAIVAWVRVHGF